MQRHNKFPEIKNLDNEFNLFMRQIEEVMGKEVTKLPSLNQVPDRARFFLRKSDGTLESWIKLNNKFERLL